MDSMIKEIRDNKDEITLDAIVDMCRDFVPGTPLIPFRQAIYDLHSNKKLLTVDEYDVIKGYLYASIERFDGARVVFIQSCYIDSKADKYAGMDLLKAIEEWALEKDCKWIYMLTKRDHKPFKRKYKFKEVGTVMRKEI